jgi:hypothetical protein
MSSARTKASCLAVPAGSAWATGSVAMTVIGLRPRRGAVARFVSLARAPIG